MYYFLFQMPLLFSILWLRYYFCVASHATTNQFHFKNSVTDRKYLNMRNSVSESAQILCLLPEAFLFVCLRNGSFKLHEHSSKMIAMKMWRGYWLLLLLVLKSRYEDVPFNELTQWKQNTPSIEISKNTRNLLMLLAQLSVGVF